MEKNKQLRLIAFLEETLNAGEMAEMQNQIQNDPELRMELAKLEGLYTTLESVPEDVPTEFLYADFHKVLESQKNQQKARSIWHSWGGSIAAGIALLALGVWLGISLQDGKGSSEQHLTELKNEIDINRQLILNAMDQPAASQRFIAVNASEQIQKPDPEIINALVVVMNSDKNTNVRLAAVRALSRFAKEEKVKEAFIKALLTQSDPLVQVALIDLLVELEEKRVVPTLEHLIKTNTTIDAVKDEAYWGVMKLS